MSETESEQFIVVYNDEEQYSIWPSWKPCPDGWHSTGVVSSKKECLDYIDKVWKDLTPKSVREAMKKK